MVKAKNAYVGYVADYSKVYEAERALKKAAKHLKKAKKFAKKLEKVDITIFSN